MKRREMAMKTVRRFLMACLALFAVCTGAQAQNKTLTPAEQERYDYLYLEAVKEMEGGRLTSAFELFRMCELLNPDAPEVNFMLSRFFVTLNQKEKGRTYMAKAAALDPDNTFYQETMAQFYIQDGRLDRAAESYERIFKANKERTDVLDVLVQIYMQQEEYDKAVETLNRIETSEGKSEKLSVAKFEIFLRQQKTDEAFAEMETLASKYPNDLKYRIIIGNLLLETGDSVKALQTYQNVLSREPDNVQAQAALLNYYQEEGNDSLAQKLLENMLTSSATPTDTKIMLMRQVVRDNEQAGGDSTEVLGLFHRVLAKPQKDADMLTLYAAYLSLKKMSADTIKATLNRVLDMEPDNAGARLQLIDYAWKDEDTDEIINICVPALQYHPDEMAFYYYLGVAYAQKKQTDDAISTFKKGISTINPTSDAAIVADFYQILGDLLHEKGADKEAFVAYDSCLQWKDDNIVCLNNYAYFLSVRNEQLDKAENMSYQVIKKEPKNTTYLDTYAWILFQQERFAEAKIYIEQALQNDTVKRGGAVVLEHAGDIYALNGEVEKAVDYWQQAKKAATDENALDKLDMKVLNRKIKRKKYIRK